MTLIVAASADHRYALMTSDCAILEQPEDGVWVRAEEARSEHKASALTDYTLIGTNGDVFATEEFHTRLRERVSRADDLEVCIVAGEQLFREMWEEDTQGIAVKFDQLVERRSIRSPAALQAMINGFFRDGTTGIAVIGPTDETPDKDTPSPENLIQMFLPERRTEFVTVHRYPGFVQWIANTPHTVQPEDIDRFARIHEDSLAKLRTPAGAFERAYSVHLRIGTDYEIISDDLDVLVLLPPGTDSAEPNDPISFRVEWTDVEGAGAAYRALDGIKYEGPADFDTSETHEEDRER
jgi:hypothetical protein